MRRTAGQGAVELVESGGTDHHEIGLPEAALVGKENGNEPHHGIHDRQRVGEKCQNTAPQLFIAQTKFI